MSEGFYDERRGDSMSWDDRHAPGCFINQWRGGLVIRSEVRDATVQGKGTPKFWPDANGEPDPTRPVKVLVITVHAPGEIDPQNPTDDGIRAIWIEKESLKYSKKNKTRPGQPKVGVKYGVHCDAMEAAGVPQTLPLPGGRYYLMQTGTVPGEGQIDRKTWAADYQVPTAATLQLLEQVTRPSQPGQPEQRPDQVFVPPSAPQQPPQAPVPPATPEAPRWQGQPQQPAYAQAPAPQQPPAPQYQQPAYAQAQAPPQQPPAQNGYQQAQQQYAQTPPPNYTQHAGNQAPAPLAPPQHQQPAPPVGPQPGTYGPNGGPPPAPQQPPAPPQYAGAPY